MIYEYTLEEWKQFTSTEQKIIIFIQKYKISDHDKLREMLNYPLPEPMKKTTYQSHWSRLKKKVEKIRDNRTIET